MRITPLDIRNHTFSSRLRGVDGDEVGSFLHLVSEDYEALVRDNESQGERIRQLEQRVEQLVADERLLKETLLSAQAMTTDLREAAVKESEVLVGEAEVKAEKILDAAHRRAGRLGEEIREMRGLRTRLASALKSQMQTHLALVDALSTDPETDEAFIQAEMLEARTEHAARNAEIQVGNEDDETLG